MHSTLDEEKLNLARGEAESRGVANVLFRCADVSKPWPVAWAKVVYARFILSHLTEPTRLLRSAMEVLDRGGTLVVEDIDMGGSFCDPPSRAYARYTELYIAAGQRRGADPLIGRRLAGLLEQAGFKDIQVGLVQPFGRTGDVKRMASLTFQAISGGLVDSGLATADEVTNILAELEAFAARPDTAMSIPRIFQAWGVKA
jgi:ubiquinone/menaquinone biosynthesis C-methylase UbiE